MGRDPTGLVRTWRHPRKIFANVYIRAAQLIVRNALAILIQTPTWSYSWRTTIQLCLLRLLHIASVSGEREACFVAAHVDESEGLFRCKRCHSLIWAATKHALLELHWHSRCGTVMLLLVQKEQHKRSFNHTLFMCYRHLNNSSTGIKVYSLV